MWSLSVLVRRLSIIRWSRLLSPSVHEIANGRSGIGKLAGEVHQTVPTVKRTPCNDCQLYNHILLLAEIELHDRRRSYEEEISKLIHRPGLTSAKPSSR